MTLNSGGWITGMLLALFEVSPVLFAPWILLLSFVCLWYFLLKCRLLSVCFPELYVILRELNSAAIVIEVSEHIHCKCNSDPGYLVPATVCKTKLLDLSWYMFMKTVMAVSGAVHPTPGCIRYSPRLAAFFLLLLSSLPLCCWEDAALLRKVLETLMGRCFRF